MIPSLERRPGLVAAVFALAVFGAPALARAQEPGLLSVAIAVAQEVLPKPGEPFGDAKIAFRVPTERGDSPRPGR
jgi:hypothetical protein